LALSPQNDESFLREVDDELRREQLTTIWKRYGRIGAVAIGVALIALAAFLWWHTERSKAAETDGEQMSAAIADLQANRKPDAETKIARLAADGTPGYKAAAMMTQAALIAQKGDLKGAAAAYAAVGADDSLAQPYRDLAVIRQTALELDTLPPAQVIERLKPLAVPGSPWFGTAGEMSAIAYIGMNKPGEAGRLLALIAADKTVPQSLRARAGRLAGSLGADIPAQTAQKD
jgi:hypothetical protein